MSDSEPFTLEGIDTMPERLTVTVDEGDGGAPFLYYSVAGPMGHLAQRVVVKNTWWWGRIGPLVWRRAAALRRARRLMCRVCNQTCPCLIYGGPVAHTHCPGGINYPLCEAHQRECLAIHRPIGADGKPRWVECCGDEGCGFCKARTRLAYAT